MSATPDAIISQLNTLPVGAPVNASMAALRLAMHDSGSGWIATPFLCDSFIHDATPVYPGAHHSLLSFYSTVRCCESRDRNELASRCPNDINLRIALLDPGRPMELVPVRPACGQHDGGYVAHTGIGVAHIVIAGRHANTLLSIVQ
jgi:hypothetical protein